eukprot:gnl/TRDRNA2_/TRDRNA2_43592_c0_seq1.p1 gnl/TRDRNA2_/TRDRNA2_43592_c0~~gnl/TRDRNA2_/TRDRNA2_43592_c0_seq1.p1  ORF type:complete len:823 (+),score=181.16 gnl/TRDRNA2_/TRDRNA2_43592_c0_seq1:81-2549(+)
MSAKEAWMAPGAVGFIGLGAMGSGMSRSLVRSGFEVHAYDSYPPALEAAKTSGVLAKASPHEVAAAASGAGGGGGGVLVLMVINCAQAEDVLFGTGKAAAALRSGDVVMLCSTVPPSEAAALSERLAEHGVLMVDAPVSGGVAKSATGELTIMAGGKKEAIDKAKGVLDAMSAKLYHVGERVGDGSRVKMVNQHLAGVHIAAAAEAMALGARAGLDTRVLYEIISNAAGNSWMFQNRVPHMLDEEYTPPKSQLNIFVKDLAIVLGEARDMTFPCPVAAAAHQQFLAGAAAGDGKLDDASVVKVFERATGVRVAAPKPEQGQRRRWPSQSLKETLGKLTPVPPGTADAAQCEVREAIRSKKAPKLVVLDDDPTGTQTVKGIVVLTEWSETSIVTQLKASAPGFFILTNSRALPTEEARALTKTICAAVAAAAHTAGDVDYTVVLRGDSTLRGHYPAEVDAAAEALGNFDATVICPFFLQGGRYSINDVHYVATGDCLVPAANTEFAKDKAFGYRESNLCDWVEEKTSGRVAAADVASLGIDEIRTGGSEAVMRRILALSKGAVIVVNAAAEADLAVFAAGLLRAEGHGRRFICRTAASFVSARLGIDASRSVPVTPASLPSLASGEAAAGGLIVVGSYVGKSTAQAQALIAARRGCIDIVEVDVPALLKSCQSGAGEEHARKAAEAADASLSTGRDVLIMTSRTLVHGDSPKESLEIGSRVSECLVNTLKAIQTRPRYLLAKGGITSSDLATKGLGVRDALVAGQAAPGVPVWLLGSASRWQNVPYIVFPGNVGSDEAVANVVSSWALRPASNSELGWWSTEQ